MGRYFIGENPSHYLSHSGRLGQRWGVRNGPPYPLNRETVSRAYGGDMQYGHYKFTTTKDRNRAYKNGFAVKQNQNEVTIAKEAQLVNPIHKGDKYRDWNCGYCTIAYDLRRRGYDVVAPDRKILKGKEIVNSYSGITTSDVQAFSLQSGEKDWNSVKAPSAERSNKIYKWANAKLKEQGIGARGMFNIAFGEDVGHAMNYEVTKNGVKIVDSQSGDVYRLSQITPFCTDVNIIRVDHLTPNYAYIKRKGLVLNA